MSFLYRTAAPEDFDRLYAVEMACFTSPLRFTRSYLRGLVAKKCSSVWLAESGEAIVGFAVVEWSRRRGEIVAYVPTIEVLDGYRRQGVGRELLGRLEEAAREAEARTLWLHVDEGNAGAIRLYEGLGYQSQERQESYYPDGAAAILYGKELIGIEISG